MTGECPFQVDGALRAPWIGAKRPDSRRLRRNHGARRSPSTYDLRPFAQLLLLFCLWLFTATVPAARAEAPSVTATLSDPATTVGEPVELRITVNGSYALGRVQPPAVDGLTIQARGTSRMSQIGPLGITEQHSYVFYVIPQRAGVFTLPETEVQVGTHALRTAPLTLTVTAAPAGSGGGRGNNNALAGAQVRAELLLPKRTVYVGEALPAELRLSFGSRVELLEPGEAVTLAGEGFVVGRWTRSQTANLRLGGGGAGARVVHKAIITAARAGTLTLGPTETDVLVRVTNPSRARSNDPFFDDPLGGLLGPVFAPPRQIKPRAEAVTVEVKPLPTAGQPADFTGGVGRFELGPVEIVSPARGTAARAGDPVTVRLAVRGQGSFDRLGAPLPESTEGLRAYEPKDRFKADDDVGLGGTKVFEQTFIPTGPRDHVPGFHLSYFDPVAGTYQTLRTPPVPLKILPGAVVAAAAPSPEPAAPPPTPAAATGPAEETLRPLRAEPGPAVPAHALRPAYSRRGFWWAQLPYLAGLAALLAGLRARARRRDVNVQRRLAAAREHARLWRTVRDPHAGRRAFLDAAVRLLEAVPADHDADVERLRARHAELAYGGEPDGEGDPPSAEERAEVLLVLREKASAGAAASPRAALAPVPTILLTAALFAFAASPSPASAAADDDEFTRGNDAYQHGRFDEAAGAYERIVARAGKGKSPVGTNVLYNLGNAYARLGERGRAAVDYRRVLLRDPRHADAAANLALVRRQLQLPAGAVLPPALPAWLTDRLPAGAVVYGGNAGVGWAAGGAWLCLGGLAVVLWPGLVGERGRRRARRVALGVGLPLAVLGAGMAWTLGRPAREAARTAVVIAKRADAHEQPADNARTVATLTEGGEVRLLLARGPWSLVELADGRRGFVSAGGLEVVGER